MSGNGLVQVGSEQGELMHALDWGLLLMSPWYSLRFTRRWLCVGVQASNLDTASAFEIR
jgi:hypothetical protein